jgi:murein DD-endopeptidase MepM/ murein hydrolase activator NlpD
MIKKTPKVFSIVFVPHSQKQSRSFSVSMKSVYIACAFVAAAILLFTGYNAYKDHISHKKLITAIKQSSTLEQQNSQISALSDKLMLNVNRLSEENETLEEKNESLKAELSDTEAQLDALIAQTEKVAQRLEELNDSESEIRQQVGLEDNNGVGGGVFHNYYVGKNMTLKQKIEYAKGLVGDIAKYLEYAENNWSDLKTDLDNYYKEQEHTPHIWPVATDGNWLISSRYGMRKDPFGNGYELHEGIDIADDRGSAIFASASGTVIEAHYESGFGNTITIDHGNGYTSQYSHCSKLLVSAGDEVLQGERIALMGSTGRSTGSHLDFRVYLHGKPVNPMDLLDDINQGTSD